MGELDWYATSFGTHRSQKFGIVEQRSPRHTNWTIGQKIPIAPNFSKFDLSVGYIPGKQNLIPDILSRWAYPASQAYRDISKHGTQEDKEEMLQMLEDKRR